MKNKSKRSVQIKSTVCAVTAMLCLAQPVWGEASTVSVTPAQAAGDLENMAQVTNSDVPDGAKISSKQAEETIKKLFPLLKKAKVTNAEFSEQNIASSGIKVWDIQFSYQRGNTNTGFNASVNAVTGDIVSVYLPRNLLLMAGGETGPELSREEASQKALEWIKQNIKSVNVSNLTENSLYLGMTKSLFSPTTYDFYYNMSIDGIPSDADQISMSVDQQGRVTSFNRQQFTAKIPSAKAKISAKEARKLYEESFTVELSYIPTSVNGAPKGPYFLGYVPKTESSLVIDANTGSKLDYSGELLKPDQFKLTEITAGSDVFKPTLKPLTNGNDAVKWVESHINIPKGYKSESKRLGQRWNDKESKVWNISWKGSDSPYGGDQIMAEVDATTGKIYSYNHYPFRKGIEVKQNKPAASSISKNEAEQMAFNTIAKLVPNAAKEWKLTNVVEPDKNEAFQSYQFSFNRYAGGISILNESISISIGTEGLLSHFTNYSYVDFSDLPNSKPVVSVEQAKAQFLKETDLKLKFAQYGGYTSGNESVQFTTKLVYSPVRKDNMGQYYGIGLPLDAITGKWHEMVPAEYSSKDIIPAKDTKGHKSQTALDKMVQYRVMIPDADGKVLPDQEITTGEWYQFVARALNPSIDQYYEDSSEPYGTLLPASPYYKAIQTLIPQSWLPYEPAVTFSVDQKLTRDELALMLTQMLKYEKLGLSFTKDDEIPGVSDSSSVMNRGAAIISMKLGLLPAVDGKFMPGRVVTRAEAAEVLLRLSEMVGKSDSFLNEYMMW
ncbi:MAG: YcdB/YcdC domain-containing protein [Bacillota bacterium]